MDYSKYTTEANEGTLPLRMNDQERLYNIRDARIEDLNFIYSTFLRGLYYGNSFYSQIPKDIFMANYKPFITNLIATGRAVINIACLKEDSDVILGYSILSSDYQAIHFVFVKSRFRKQGIARSLVPQRPVAVTHLTGIGRILLTKFPHTIFNPFKL